MHYELNWSFPFWRWLVPPFGEGRSLTKAGAKRSAEAMILSLKAARRLSSQA